MREADQALFTLCGSPPIDPAALTALLRDGAAPSPRGHSGHMLFSDTVSALHLVGLSRDNPPEAAQLLLDAGADPNNPSDRCSWTPLHLAAAMNHTALVRLLLSAGAAPDLLAGPYQAPTPLIACINFNVPLCAPTVRVLLDAGADPDLRHPDRDGALHTAVQATNLPAVEALLAAGADPDLPGRSGETPLMQAVTERDGEAIVRALLRAGARIDAGDRHLSQPIHHAVLRGSVESVRLLLGAGADINARDKDQETPLLRWLGWRARPTPPEVLDLLIGEGANVSAIDGEGWPALHRAIQKGEADTVQRLVEAGADPEQRGPDGRSASALAAAENPVMLSVMGVTEALAVPSPTEGALQLLRAGRTWEAGDYALRWVDGRWSWRRNAWVRGWTEEAVREHFTWMLLFDAEEAERLAAWMADAPWPAQSVPELRAELEAREPERAARCRLPLDPAVGPQIIEAAVRAGYAPVRSDKEGFWTWRFLADQPEETAFHFREAGEWLPQGREIKTDAAALRRHFGGFRVEQGRLAGGRRRYLDGALKALGCPTERCWLSGG